MAKQVRITASDDGESALVIQGVQSAVGSPLLGSGNIVVLPAMFKSVDEFRCFVQGIADRMGIPSVEVKRVSN